MMRRLLLSIAMVCVAALAADAQLIPLTGAGGKSKISSAACSYTGPGDVVSSAAAWYGLRAYSCAFAATHAPAANIRRASDNETCNILLVSAGGLGLTASCSGADSGVAVSTFCNATTCFVVTLYDQTSHGVDITQASAGNEPRLVLSCTNSLPCLQFDASHPDYLLASGTVNPGLPQTFTAFYNSTDPTNGLAKTMAMQGLCGLEVDGGGPNFASFSCTGGSTGDVAANDNAWHGAAGIATAASTIVVDNAATTVALGNTDPGAGNPIMGAAVTFTQFLTGKMTEGGIWPAAFNATQYGNMCHNQAAYWTAAPAC